MEWENKRNEMRVNGWIVKRTAIYSARTNANPSGWRFDVLTLGRKKERRTMERFGYLSDAVEWARNNSF
jgi:hypothetical protein